MSDRKSGSVGSAFFALVIGLFGGYLFGWWTNDNPECRYSGIFIAIVGVVAIKIAREFAVRYEAAKMDVDISREKNSIALKKLQVEEQKLAVRSMEAQEKVLPKYAFTSNDFDDTAKSILNKPVKEARRAGAKVSGQGLIETILRGIK